ncbi:uroporphyrinogen-III synthase [Oceanobacillus massiliensis]|uniref:uroporphyrinogen-III synthase n=1 Tax=Oceanobacillus massiliensis TaxID=1465765 RepID=UPI000288DCCA|nr:uroporphyrinogen-III synthase [Oceanobacillus massiliensis]
MTRRIGIAANRRADAIAALVHNIGGISHLFPIQGEQILNERTSEQDVLEMISNPFDLIVLTTGIGITTLENAAIRLDCLPEFIGELKNRPLAVRGSKTMKWLKKHSLSPTFLSEDGTMENLLESLTAIHPDERNHTFLQTYNQDDLLLRDKLEDLGYDVYLSKPYQYRKPVEEILFSLKQHIMNQTLDAVIFTSKTQVENLFGGSREAREMVNAFNENVIAVAVGKVTASQLKQKGICHVVQPANQRMGAMVIELKKYLAAD